MKLLSSTADPITEKHVHLGLLLLRLGLGGMLFLHHGLPNLLAGPEKWRYLGQAMGSLGIDYYPVWWGLAACLVQCLGGICLILGVAMRPACGLMAFTLLVAAVQHFAKGEGLLRAAFPIEVGFVLVCFQWLGAGRYRLAFSKRSWARLLAVLVLGMVVVQAQAKTKQQKLVPQISASVASQASLPEDTDDEALTKARIFKNGLVAGKGSEDRQEDHELAVALNKRRKDRSMQSVQDFLSQHPQSRWKTSLLLGLGQTYRQGGRLSKSMEVLKQSWEAGKVDSKLQETADNAAAELLDLYARTGHVEELDDLLKQVEGHRFKGVAAQYVMNAKGSLKADKTHPDLNMRCGSFALGQIYLQQNPNKSLDHKILSTPAVGSKGFSLNKLAALAGQVGLDMVMAKRVTGSAMVLPALAHWKAGHYAALLKENKGLIMCADPSLSHQKYWMDEAAIDEESSGYFLVPRGPLPAGWSEVTGVEGASVFGKGYTNGPQPSPPNCNNTNAKGCPSGCQSGGGGSGGGCNGMPIFNIDVNRIAPEIFDTPLEYTPPVGPPISFSLAYNGAAANSQVNPVGYNWSFNFGSYISWTNIFPTDDCNNQCIEFICYPRGGGEESYKPDSVGQYSGAVIKILQTATEGCGYFPVAIERDLPSGWREIYGQSWGLESCYLTQIIDPQGNSVQLAYDSYNRLSTMTDAIGQVTTFSYNDSADANRITQVTDPFGRFCSLQYDENGNLTSVTDMQGMTSTFAYQHSINANLLTSMTTPYGTTTFAFSGEPNYDCTLLVTEPDGEQEKAEFDQTINYAEPDLPIPVGLTVTPNTTFIGMRDSYFWDENAMQLAPGDFSKARVYHWMHTPDGVYRSNLLESMKNPLESRTWFDYPGQTDPIIESTNMQSLPSMVARVLDDGSTQLEQYAYNAQNKVTQSVDAAGRVMYYDYDPNGADLLDVRDGSGDILTTTTYNAGHEPITSTDAAGKVTHYSYNGQGQLTSVQRPSGATTTLNYNGQGFLTSVQPPQPGATVSFTYDNFNRVQTTTDAVNGTLTYSYDNLNRLLSVAYPDGTHETLTYNKLDVNTVTDRKGHTTTMTYDALRHLRTVVDPDNRLTQYNFCGCGALRQLIDAAGNATNWTYDVAMRPIIKAYADGSQYQYQYENRSSRIKAVTDAKGQASNYGYFIDNRLEAISYVNAKVSTPNVAFQYDSLLGRLTQMTDGTGQTTYNYYPFASGQLGAGRLSSVGVAYTGVQISYLYDMDGRIVGRGVNGTLESYTYDTNARLTQVSNPLGNFGYQYNPSTANLSEIDYPNGQKTSLSYYDASKSGWLKEINNQGVGGSNLSDFTYDYDPAGQITSWAKTIANNPSQAYTFTYDPAGQLTQAVQSQGSGMTYAYTYDAAGNRTLETMNGVGTSSAANNLNQLMNVYGNSGTKVQFQGKAANVLASVTINGLSATVNTDQTFSTFMSLTPGVANTITITAADVSGDTVTHRYSILNGYKPTYDANGNMNRDGHYQYTWDAENRLVAISLLYPGVGNPAKSWDFAYDGFGRRVDEKYILGATLAQETRYVWAGSDLVEARGTDGSVWKRYFGTGMQILSPTAQAGVYYYTSDHLGSIRELTDATGAVRAEYDYDPWGRRTKLSGDLDADFGFTGDFEHASGLKLTWYREYNPDLGRWLSRDPLRIQGGEINLYAYVNDNPINLLDLFGLCPNNSGENTGQDNQAQNASDWDNVKKTEQMNGIPTDEYEEASLDVARANQVTAKRVALAYAGIGAAVIVAGLALVAAEAIGEGLAGAASWQLVSADLAGEGLFDSYHLKEIWDKVQKLLGNGDVCENNQ